MNLVLIEQCEHARLSILVSRSFTTWAIFTANWIEMENSRLVFSFILFNSVITTKEKQFYPIYRVGGVWLIQLNFLEYFWKVSTIKLGFSIRYFDLFLHATSLHSSDCTRFLQEFDVEITHKHQDFQATFFWQHTRLDSQDWFARARVFVWCHGLVQTQWMMKKEVVKHTKSLNDWNEKNNNLMDCLKLRNINYIISDFCYQKSPNEKAVPVFWCVHTRTKVESIIHIF